MYVRFKIQTNSSIRHLGATTVTVAFLLTSTLLLSSCAEMNEGQQNTARGAGIGTVAGAVIGGITGGSRGAVTGAVLGAGAGAAGGYIWSRKMEEQKRSMEHATAGTGVAVSQTADNQLKLEVPSDVSFDVGRADIKANFRPILEKFAQGLAANPGATVRVIGHTDSTGSDALNKPLSLHRAESVKSYLGDRGALAGRITVDGRGEHEPIAENTTDAGRAKNRRVEIFMGEPPVAQAPAPAPTR